MAVAETYSLKYDQGNDEQINLDVNDSGGNAQDITGWTFTLSVGGVLTETASIVDASGGTARFTLDNTETADLDGSYVYEMEYETDGGTKETFLRGIVSWYDKPVDGSGVNETDITVTTGNETSVTVTSAAPAYSDEQVRDVIGTALTAGDNIDVTVNDTGDTITITSPEEDIQDVVGSLATAGNAIDVIYDDNANTLTIAVDETAISHDNIADVSPNDHIDNLTDIPTRNHNDIQNISSDDHHPKYTDAEARGSINDVIGSDGKADKDVDLDGYNAKNLGTLTFNADGTLKPGADSTTAFQFQNAAGDNTVLNIDTSNERVGIGTTTPDKILHIVGANPILKFVDSNTGRTAIFGSEGGYNFVLDTPQGGYIIVKDDLVATAGGSERLGISNRKWEELWINGFTVTGGSAGIGTTSPDTKLHNSGAVTQEPLSADPADPSAGNAVTWVSDGMGSGDAGDVMMKINVGGTVKTITLVDYSAH